MKADILRKSILQYAIQGKLVSQIPSEESAHILLEKIKKEKQELVKQGKLKKEKPLAGISEDELPFDIPESWTWVRLGTISNLYTGDSINEDEKRKKYTDIKEGLNYIGTKDVNFDTTINYENGIRISDWENFEIARANSILLCIEGGSAGRKIGILNQDVCFGNKLCCFSPFLVESKYLFYFLRTPIFIDNFKTNKTGMIGGVGVNTLKTILFSLPPLAEQKRIVEKIEELMALVDKYELYETELDKLEIEFPERLKKSILQYAIQGKLVPQIPSEESAHILLEKIKKEKQDLIKQGKLKKEKPLAEICDDEMSFDIPENWKWTKLAEICHQICDGTHKTPTYIQKGIRFLSVQNISSGKIDLNKIKYINEKEHLNLIKRTEPKNGDILICRIGTLGKPIIVDFDFDFSIFVSLGLLKLSKLISNLYICKLLDSPYAYDIYDKIKVGGGTHTNKLNLCDINNIILPIPPLEEQKRIVAKIEKIFAFIDLLSSEKKVAVNKITIPSSSTEETKNIEFPKPKFDAIDFELAARQAADVPSDTMKEVVRQVKEHYDNKD